MYFSEVCLIHTNGRFLLGSQLEEYKRKSLVGHWVLVKEPCEDLQKEKDKSLKQVFVLIRILFYLINIDNFIEIMKKYISYLFQLLILVKKF